MAQQLTLDKGLAHTIAAETSLSYIDGENGILEYVGIDIDALARNSTFEETTALLWRRRLPTSSELAEFERDLHAAAPLSGRMVDVVRALPRSAPPMHALRTLVSALAHEDPEADDISPAAAERKAMRLVACTPGLVAAFDRHRKGKTIIEADPANSIARDFLRMLNGRDPTPAMANALDVCLVLHADHGLNASTFAARVTIATLSDMYSAMTTAVGTLKGPLHGGANEGVMRMLAEIGSMERVEPFVKDHLARKDKIMGFGHRVYKTYDPRAKYLKTFAKQIAEDTGNLALYEMSTRIEQVMHEAVAAKGIYPNVDFYSATTYASLGLDLDLFTCIFAMSRMSGWTAHCIEQLTANALIRPHAAYVGPHGAPYTPIASR